MGVWKNLRIKQRHLKCKKENLFNVIRRTFSIEWRSSNNLYPTDKDMQYWLLLDSTVNEHAYAPVLALALRETVVKAELEGQEMFWVEKPVKDKGERV